MINERRRYKNVIDQRETGKIQEIKKCHCYYRERMKSKETFFFFFVIISALNINVALKFQLNRIMRVEW